MFETVSSLSLQKSNQCVSYCHFGKVTTMFHKYWVFQSFKYGIFCLKDPRMPIYKWVLQEASCKRATLMPSILKVKIQSHLVWLCWGKISYLSKFFGNSVFHDFVYRQIDSFQVIWTSLKKRRNFSLPKIVSCSFWKKVFFIRVFQGKSGHFKLTEKFLSTQNFSSFFLEKKRFAWKCF